MVHPQFGIKSLCENCAAFSPPHALGGSAGTCHRYPPKKLDGGWFPHTAAIDFCLEWHPSAAVAIEADRWDEFFSRLSARGRHCLSGQGIKSLEALDMLTDKDLLRIPNLGDTTWREIRHLREEVRSYRRGIAP